jgi:sulfite exporter TauE/SafE
MNSLDFYSMFMLGLLGTGHCIGMCGPLVLAFPSKVGGISFHLAYNSGRVAMYAAIGAALGAAGVGLEKAVGSCCLARLPFLAPIQVGFSLVAAALLLVLGLSRMNILGEPSWMSVASPTKIPGFGKLLRSIMVNKSLGGMFLIGLMMGLLPCGLSYAAFARALPSGGIVTGTLLVATFGMGTMPGMLLMGSGAGKLFQRYRKPSDIISGLLMIAMAVSLCIDAAKGIAG